MDRAEIEKYVGKMVIVTIKSFGEYAPRRISRIKGDFVHFEPPFDGDRTMTRCLLCNIETIRGVFD